MIKARIVGSTGYTGAAPLRILAQHPTAITSRGEAGALESEMFPSLRRRLALRFEGLAVIDLAKCMRCIFCLRSLVKCAAGQAAMQTMNVKFGFAETAGLWQLPVLP